MKTLNCKRIGSKISLYVAGDLVGESEREVAAHLLACEECRRLSEEFSASSRLLTQAYTLPEFGSEFYSGIRRSVLADIGRGRTQSTPSLFRPRWLYATAFAAVVIASGVMLQHFSSTRRQASQILALAPKVTGQPTSDPAKGISVSSSPQSHGLSGMPRAQVRGKFGPVRRPDASDSAQAGRKNSAQIAQAMQSPTSVGAVTLELATLSDGSASSPSGRASSSQVSRIEIQTANPNIRIIWLAPRESEGAEETNRDQDQHENENRK
jgi:hypothetical protein